MDYFFTKNRHESHSKNSLEEGPISHKKNEKKKVKSAVFEAENPLEMGLDLQKFRKKKTVQSAVFWMRKILRYG